MKSYNYVLIFILYLITINIHLNYLVLSEKHTANYF